MNIVREVRKAVIEVPGVDDVEEARTVMKAVLANEIEDPWERDATNGLVEAFFVSHLRDVSKEGLKAELTTLTAEFGDYNPFKRAVVRVKAFRGKNPAFKG